MKFIGSILETGGWTRQPGVYRIFHLQTGKQYFGSTKDLAMRRSHHASCLRLKKHNCKELQSDFDLYGSASVLFEILEVIPNASPLVLRDAEQRFIDSVDFDNLYNYCPCARDWTGAKHRPETIESLRHRIVSEKTRRSLSKAHKGRAISMEQRMKTSRTTKGQPKQPAHAAKLKSICARRNTERSKIWRVISPDGDDFVIQNLNAFCREKCLDQAAMQRVASGKVKQHKGWKCFYVTE